MFGDVGGFGYFGLGGEGVWFLWDRGLVVVVVGLWGLYLGC